MLSIKKLESLCNWENSKYRGTVEDLQFLYVPRVRRRCSHQPSAHDQSYSLTPATARKDRHSTHTTSISSAYMCVCSNVLLTMVTSPQLGRPQPSTLSATQPEMYTNGLSETVAVVCCTRVQYCSACPNYYSKVIVILSQFKTGNQNPRNMLYTGWND